MAQLYKVFLWSLCTIMSDSGISLIRVLTFQSSRPYVSMYVYIYSVRHQPYTYARISLFCQYSLQIRLDIIIRLSVILGTCFLALVSWFLVCCAWMLGECHVNLQTSCFCVLIVCLQLLAILTTIPTTTPQECKCFYTSVQDSL
jgi:hypothetical protein